MSNNLGVTFWSPFLLAVASGAFSVFWGSTKGLNATTVVSGALTAVFIVAAFLVARCSRSENALQGGKGGDATASGDRSDAEGGPGGRGLKGTGGDGGNAVASGKGALARGGRGGEA